MSNSYALSGPSGSSALCLHSALPCSGLARAEGKSHSAQGDGSDEGAGIGIVSGGGNGGSGADHFHGIRFACLRQAEVVRGYEWAYKTTSTI